MLDETVENTCSPRIQRDWKLDRQAPGVVWVTPGQDVENGAREGHGIWLALGTGSPSYHPPPSQGPLCFGHEEYTLRTHGFRERVQT